MPLDLVPNQPLRLIARVETLKSLDENSRVIEGIANSASVDRRGDILEPSGAIFDLPLPLLNQHRQSEPVGEVLEAKIKGDVIRIVAKLAAESAGLDYVEKLWKQIKAGLVKGLSVGAQPLRAEPILDKGGRMTGVRYTAWRWYETSAVTIAANQDASITTLRAMDPWGARLGPGHDPADDRSTGEPAGYPEIRGRAVAALQLAHTALRRG